ncbi:MAG: CsbD family protein [Anaerolineae bacterium]|jgi:uncharacterized protein YjbJ (UPF0337 family)
MARDEFEGRWRQLRGRVKAAWGDLTDDELDRIEGRRDQLIGLLQEKTGEARQEIERKLDELLRG